MRRSSFSVITFQYAVMARDTSVSASGAHISDFMERVDILTIAVLKRLYEPLNAS